MATTYTTSSGATAIDFDAISLYVWGDKVHKSIANEPCIVCGRETSNKNNAKGVYVTEGGSSICLPTDIEKEIARRDVWMGFFPIGSECIKAVPAEFRASDPFKK